MGPLQDIKVIDLTSMVSGPVAAMMLADQGARVIKVEPPAGEQMRHLGRPHSGVPAMFYSCNRGKESIALDLKSEAGKEVLADLLRDADVLLQNFRPGAMERMGFGEAAVRELNEKIVYVSISGFGETRPLCAQAGLRPGDPGAIPALPTSRRIAKPQAAMFRIIIADKVTS